MLNIESLPVMDQADARKAGLIPVLVRDIGEAESKFASLVKRARGRLRLASVPTLAWEARGNMTLYRAVYDASTGEHVAIPYKAPAAFARVSGPVVKIAGWSLAARLETLATGERMIQAVPGVAVPERFRATGDVCEHCNTARNRKDTFVLHNESGEWKQVGRQCLRDFLGHDPAALLASYTAVKACAELLDRESGAWAERPTYDTVSALGLTVAAIRRDGWISRAKSQETGYRSTADVVRNNLAPPYPENRLRATEADMTEAREVLAWVRTELAARVGSAESDYDSNNYEANLVASLKHDSFDGKACGIACSAVSAYQRAMAKRQERAADADSQYMGKEKERLKNLPVTLTLVKYMESAYGTSTLIKMRCAGNVLSWFASGYQQFTAGDECILTGTVKRHNEYQGVKETQLSRCVLVPAAVTKAA